MTAPSWPFVGRDEQLARVRRLRRGAGTRVGVVLVGPSGSGLTRLARMAADAATRDAWTVRWAMATRSASQIPLGALAQLLPDAAEPLGEPVLARVAARLTEGTDGRRLVLVVNDAHLLDTVSASTVHHLAVTRSAFLVLTAPSGVAVPDPVFALWRENLIERVDVHEFDEDETAELLRRVVDGPVDAVTAHRVHTLAAGNVTHLRELVEDGLRRRALAARGGVWRWTGPMRPSRRLRDLVRARLGPLSPAEQEALELLAFGGDLDADGLLRRYDADLLDRIEQRGLVTSRRTGDRVDVALARPLYGEVLRSAASPLRERVVHQQLAAAFDAFGGSADQRVRTLAWRLLGGMATSASTLAAAAEAALATGSADRAATERVARAAVELGGGFAASMVLARALIGAGRAAEAEELLAGLAAEADTDERRVDVAGTRLANLQWGLAAPAAAAELARGLDAPSWGDPGRPASAVLRAAALLHDGAYADALALVAPLAAEPGRLGSLARPAAAVAAEALCGLGRYQAAWESVERARVDLAGVGSRAGWGVVELDAAACAALVGLCRLDEACAEAESGLRRAVAADDPVARCVYGGWRGIALVRHGRLRAALDQLNDAVGAAGDRGLPFVSVLLAHVAQVAAMLGDLPAATGALERAEGPAHWAGAADRAWVAIAGVWVAVAEGRPGTAPLAAEAAQAARIGGHRQPELHAWHTCVRLGSPDAAVDGLRALAEELEGPVPELYLRHATALAAADGVALDAVAAGFAQLGLVLLAAEAAAQAARAHAAAGRGGAATAAATRAREWAQRCQGAATAALTLLGQVGELTPREAEIAALAASGMTSRTIAAQLVVSIRTVDNVLHGVYRKLGVSGRRDLAALVSDRIPEQAELSPHAVSE